MTASRASRFSLGFGIAVGLLVYFAHQGLSSNGHSRLLTVWALVEDHTLQADRWAQGHNDRAVIDGHSYSEKAPLSSFVMLPFYWLYRMPSRAPQTEADMAWSWHMGVLVCAVIPFVLWILMMLWRLESETTVSPRRIVWMVLLTAFGSTTFQYGNNIFGHMLGGTLFLAAYILAITRAQHFFAAGFLGGLAVLAEYPMAIGVVLVGGALLHPARSRRNLVMYLAGGVIPAFLLLLDNRLVTGHWLDFPYFHILPQFRPSEHELGFAWPRLGGIYGLTFSACRGAFFFTPVLVVFVPVLLAAPKAVRGHGWLVLSIAVSHWLFVSTYHVWTGGWCTGPRHLVPVIMLMSYEALPALARLGRFWRLFLALGVAGLLLHALAAVTDPLPSDQIPMPLFEFFVPNFVAGKMNSHNLLTELCGLPATRALFGLWLLLFCAVGAGSAWALGRTGRR